LGVAVSRLQELADRCEKADGPSRDLDQDIHEAVFIGGAPTERAYPHCGKVTVSLDDALKLVPRGDDWTLSAAAYEPCLATIPSGDDRVDAVHGYAATPALAICAAALKARARGEAQ
jgi:hypothetical protein